MKKIFLAGVADRPFEESAFSIVTSPEVKVVTP